MENLLVERAAATRRPEEVEVLVLRPDEGTLGHVLTSGVVLKMVVRGILSNASGIGKHGALEKVLPEGTKREVILVTVLHQVGVDRIEGVALLGLHASESEINPCAVLHSAADCKTNGRLLGAKGRNGIVAIVESSNLAAIGGLIIEY